MQKHSIQSNGLDLHPAGDECPLGAGRDKGHYVNESKAKEERR